MENFRKIKALYAIIIAMMNASNIRFEYEPCTANADVNALRPEVLGHYSVMVAAKLTGTHTTEEEVLKQLHIISKLWRDKDA